MAKSPGGKSVGKVSVRVVPDTSKFREELAAQLKREMAGFSVKVPVRMDTKNLSQFKKDIGTVSNDLQKLDFTKAFNFDMTPLEHAMGRALVAVNNIKKGIGSVLTKTKQMAISFRDSVNVVGRMRNYWKGVRNEVGSTGKSVARVLSTRAFKSVLGSIQKVGRGFRNIGKAARAGLSGLGSATSSVASGLGRMAAGALSATKALIPTSRAALILFAVLAGGAPILGLIAGLLAGLPSLALLAAAPIAAVALGFDGIKKAASVLSDEVDHLKKSLSATFEKGMTPVFEKLQSIFPVLEKGLNKVAEGTIGWASAFTDVVTSARGSAQIGGILDNIAKFFQQTKPFITNFTQAFLSMAELGSQSFDLLAGVLNNFAASFAAMIERVGANGVFRKAMEGLAKVTDALLQVFVRLFEAGLQVMGQIGGPLASLITALGNALVALVPILGSITNLVAAVLTPVLNALATVFNILGPPIEKILNLLGTVLVGVFDALLPIINALAIIVGQVLKAAFDALEPVIHQLIPIFAQIAAIVAGVLMEAFKAIQPLIKPMLELFGQLAVIIGEALVQALDACAPIFDILAQFIADVVKELKPLMPSISELATVLADMLVQVLRLAVPLFIQLAKTVLPVLLAAIKALVPFIKQMVEIFKEIVSAVAPVISALLSALAPAFQTLIDIVRPILDALLKIIQGVFTAIKGVFDVIIGVLTGDWARAWEGIKEIFSGAWDAIWAALQAVWGLIVDFFTKVPGAIISALGNLLGLLYQVGKDILTGLWNGIKEIADQIWTWFGKIKDIVLGFFKDVGTWLYNVGKDLVMGLWNGWKRYFKDFKQATIDDSQTLIDNIRGIFGTHSPSTVFMEIGKNLGQGLTIGMNQQRNEVFAAGAKMAGQVTNGFGTPVLNLDWAKEIEKTTPSALKAVDAFSNEASARAQAQFSGQLLVDGEIQPIADQIADAMEGVEVKMDSRPVGKLINARTARNKRRS